MRARAQMGGAEREGESSADSKLSAEPQAGLGPMTPAETKSDPPPTAPPGCPCCLFFLSF